MRGTSRFQCVEDTAYFGQSAETTNQRITGKGLSGGVVEQFMPMIRTKRESVIVAPAFPTATFFGEEGGAKRDHIGVAFEMGRLFKRAIGEGLDISQMHEMNPVRKTRRNCGDIVRGVGAKRSRAKRKTVGNRRNGRQDPVDVVHVRDDAR